MEAAENGDSQIVSGYILLNYLGIAGKIFYTIRPIGKQRYQYLPRGNPAGE
jgi:hypothetical protein